MNNSDIILQFEIQKRRPDGKTPVSVKSDGKAIHIDNIDLSSEAARAEFSKKIREKYPAISAELVETELVKIASTTTEKIEENRSQADRLVELVGDGVDLFHDPNKDGYATIKIEDHFETYRIRTKGFKTWLVGQFYRKNEKAPNSQALTDALNVIEGKAI